MLSKPSTVFALPPCLEHLNVVLDNCFGTIIHANGNKYVGEWLGGKCNGQGIYTAVDLIRIVMMVSGLTTSPFRLASPFLILSMNSMPFMTRPHTV